MNSNLRDDHGSGVIVEQILATQGRLFSLASICLCILNELSASISPLLNCSTH